MPHIDTMFPSRYVKASELGGKDFTLQIRQVQSEKVRQGSEERLIWVVYFHRAQKGLVLNKTLSTQIAALYGPTTEQWINQYVTLYPTKIKAFGELFEVIRIRPEKPKPTPPTTPNQPAENQLDDLEDIADDVDDDVPFAEKGCGLRAAEDDETQPEYSTDDPSVYVWESPLEAQAWAVEEGLAADATDAQKLWIEAVRACHGFDRTKAPMVYTRYVDLLRSRQPASRDW